MKIKIQFDGHSFEMDLLHKYTCIIGKDSGEGKSELYALMENAVTRRSIDFQAPYPVCLATPGTIMALLGLPMKYIFIIDEFSVLHKDVLRAIQDSQHLFICITRGIPRNISVSNDSFYHVKRNEVFFDVIHVNELMVVEDVVEWSK